MTKENLTSINVIIDASGSMQGLANDTIGSFNTFLKEQKDFPGEALFTLCTFNSTHRIVHDFVKIASVSDLDTNSYQPGGYTALLDAMGHTMEIVGQKLAALPEEERPSKVIFLVITDGEENSSFRYTSEQIKNMVEHQKDKYSWEFVFFGASLDQIAAGQALGISMNNTMSYTPSSAGTHQLYNTISSSMTSYRASNSSRANFFDPGNALPIVDAFGNPIPSKNSGNK